MARAVDVVSDDEVVPPERAPEMAVEKDKASVKLDPVSDSASETSSGISSTLGFSSDLLCALDFNIIDAPDDVSGALFVVVTQGPILVAPELGGHPDRD